MKLFLQPLYSQLNSGVGNCPLGCTDKCVVTEKAPSLKPPNNCSCPLSSHQAQTYAEVMYGDADIISNQGATGDGKSLGAHLPGFINPDFRIMGLYPTIELVEDQAEQQKRYHALFNMDVSERVDRLFGAELAKRVKEANSNKFQELLLAIQQKPILLTNPDIFHYITHYQYRDPAYGNDLLPMMLAKYPDLWVLDEFHIFGCHQETAALNSLALIRRSQENSRPRRFLFTSATPKYNFIEQLHKVGFKVASVKGVYANEPTSGFRPILQPVELEFVELKDNQTQTWLQEMAPTIQNILDVETKGRGLIIVNSVAKARQVTQLLTALLPGVIVCEISGRIDRQTRLKVQAALKDATQPVLVVATSAVDVGVDFKIHLLIFEGSDSATVVQRLGRLGRHEGFSVYKAFILIPGHTPWVMARLQEKLVQNQTAPREDLTDAIAYAFDPPKEFEKYRQHWGALQAQGMFWQMSRDNAKVSEQVRAHMTEDLQRAHSQDFEAARKQWYAMKHTDLGKATQQELLRFRGGSTLQAAVWDDNNFYTYDLLRLLPYARVEILDRETFLKAVANSSRGEEEFPKEFITVYLRIQEWFDERINDISLHCNRSASEMSVGQLCLIDKLSLVGHPQSDVITCLQNKKLLTFLVPINKNQAKSHWQVSNSLKLSPLFGLYRLTNSSEAFACGFNQDALLLDALKWHLKKFTNTRFESSIF